MADDRIPVDPVTAGCASDAVPDAVLSAALPDGAVLDTVLRPGDLGAIAEQHGRLYAAEYGFDHRFEAYVAAGLAGVVQDGASPPPRFWLVRDAVGGRLLGSAAVSTSGPGVAQLRWFLLDSALRSHGLGTTLLAACLAHCRTAGYQRILLWTVDVLDAAATLYRRAGFTVAERHGPVEHWGVPVIEVRYELALS